MNTEKSKIMVFKKGQGRRTRLEFKWKEEVLGVQISSVRFQKMALAVMDVS